MFQLETVQVKHNKKAHNTILDVTLIHGKITVNNE